VSPSTYNNRLAILTSCYTHAIRKCQLLQYNPIERLEPRTVGKEVAPLVHMRSNMHSQRACLVINTCDGQNVAKLPAILAVFSAAGWHTDVVLKEYGCHAMESACAGFI
jgi:acetaldehyde dehydrogenase (acetylating)